MNRIEEAKGLWEVFQTARAVYHQARADFIASLQSTGLAREMEMSIAHGACNKAFAESEKAYRAWLGQR